MRTALFLIVCADPALGIGSVPVASADENPAAVPREEITPSPAKASAPTACRRPFLLSAATPEERERLTEERKRLSAAAKSGTDRTAVVGFYQLACGHKAFTR